LAVGGHAAQSVLATCLRMSGSTVWKSLRRLRQLNFFESAAADSSIDKYKLFNLLVHGVPLFFTAQTTSQVRGIPTGIFSPLFRERFTSFGDPVLVWPYGRGKELRSEVGDGLIPIYPSIPSACALDPTLYEVMAAVEILRMGRRREQEAAENYLREKLKIVEKPPTKKPRRDRLSDEQERAT
jgi:hypothetical protein